jgi:hypothetical protein
VWVCERYGNRVRHFSAQGAPIGTAFVEAPSRVLGLNLATLAVEVTVTNVGTPYDLDVDSATGQVWVVSRNERIVVRLAPDGTRLDLLEGFSDPVQVRVDPGLY